MTAQPVTITINGLPYTDEVEPNLLLVHFIRWNAGLTGTHIGCDTTHCGACAVLVDGTPMKSCTMLAVQADGSQVQTVEGLARDGDLHPMQEAFSAEHGLQCGWCTPAMMLTAAALLERDPDPDEATIRDALSGNLCRCTGYQNIVAAVRRAATARQAGVTEVRSAP